MSKITTAFSAFVFALLTGCASNGGDFVGTGVFSDGDNDPANHVAAWPYQKMAIDD